MTILYLAPVWFGLWFTANYAKDIEYEFGAWWTYLAVAPLFLFPWAAITVFPFMLTARLREIQQGR